MNILSPSDPATGAGIAEQEPWVTVLLPTMRVDQWCRIALESILHDGYPRLKVILLLDGIQEVPADPWLHDSRVTLVPLGTRGGIARALNTGLGLATSEFIARMDGDDVSLPGRLIAQVRLLQENSRVAVVGCQATRINEHNAHLGPLTVPTGDYSIKRRLLTRNSMIHPTVMFRKSAVLEAGGYSPRARTTEDYDLYLQLAQRYELANLPGCYLHYRVHSQQISRGFNPFSADKFSLIRLRHRLARSMGVGVASQFVRDAIWYGAQIARCLRLRRRPWEPK